MAPRIFLAAAAQGVEYVKTAKWKPLDPHGWRWPRRGRPERLTRSGTVAGFDFVNGW